MEVKKEIGSFLELDFPKGLEYYKGNIARLNSARAGIYHAAHVLNCHTVFLPYYQCETVRDFLIKKGIKVLYYSMDRNFNPKIQTCPEDTAIVLVNYFGIMGYDRMSHLSSNFQNVIIDNSQAFFAPAIKGCLNVYSARKFIGVPDGAYVIGNQGEEYLQEYELDYSSDTSLFLLQRIEYGCEGKVYQAREANEARINQSDIKRMSKLTHAILDGTDYEYIKSKRRGNFETACNLFDNINKINPGMFYSDDCIPMVYPLVVEDEKLLPKLLKHKVFQGHWWNYLLGETNPDSFEYYMSKYMIPITIDQRYGENEMKYIFNIISKELGINESIIDNNVMA
jgi:hypothetical protein